MFISRSQAGSIVITYMTAKNTEAKSPARRRKIRTLRIEVMTIIPPLLRPGQVSIVEDFLTRREINGNSITPLVTSQQEARSCRQIYN